MKGNKAYIADYQEFKGGSVAFGGSNGWITDKGKMLSEFKGGSVAFGGSNGRITDKGKRLLGDKIEKNTDFKTCEKPELEKHKRQEKEANDAVESPRKEATYDIKNASTSSTNLINTASTPHSTAGPSRAFNDGKLSYPHDPLMPHLKDIYASPSEGIFTNSSYDDEGVISQALENESWVDATQEELLQFQIQKGHRQEEGIDYDEVFATVARIEAIRIFLAFASYMGFIVYQMDVKSAFLYGIIYKEVYVSQPPGFVDPKFPNKVYKVVKALYGLHQALRAWYATLSTFLEKSRYRRGAIDKTLFIKQDKKNTMLVQVYVDDIIFGSTKKSWYDEFQELMKNSVKTASTPIETQKPLVKEEEAADVDVTLKTSHLQAVKRIFRRLISWQCKKQTIVATSTTKAEYVAAAYCCGQVLWIQNQLLDYGFNFMNTKIYIDNESTICIVKNPVFHPKTKHTEIRHHFIRDAYEKNIIQVLKIHTDDNVADLLTKAFDVSRLNFLSRNKRFLVKTSQIRLWLTICQKLYGIQVTMLHNKELASPKQTALGKDISNSLMAGRLPKTTLPTSLVKNIEAGVPFFMFSRFVQLLINHELGDMSHHKEIYDNSSLTKKVFANMKRVVAGFSGVVTPLFATMLVLTAQEVSLIQDDVQSTTIPTAPSTSKPYKKDKPKKQQPQAPKVPSPKPSPKHRLPSYSNDLLPGGEDSLKLKELMDLCTHSSNKVLELESEVIDIKSTNKDRIENLKGKVDKLEEENRVLKELHNVEINLEEAWAKLYRIDLEHPGKVLSMQDVNDEEPTDVEEVLKVVKAAKLMTKVVTTAGATTIAEATKVSVPMRRRCVVIQDPKETKSTVVVHSKVQYKDKGKCILIEEPKSLKGQAHIKQDEAFARQLGAKLNANINWNAVMEQVKRSERLNDAGITYNEIRPLFEKYYNYNQAFLKEVNEEVTVPEKKVEVEGHKREGESLKKEITKKPKMDEEAEELKSHLEYLESLWKLVKERFEKTEPKNYTDDNLLKTIKTMFEQPDVEASVWRDQKGRYGLAKMADAKEMWEAIKSIFGGNDESKKMQKYLLKQQFEGFFMSASEGLHKGYDRFQTLLSQLEIHGAGVSHEDVNQKFLSAPQLDCNDLEQINDDDLEKMDLKWQVAMISIKINKFYIRTSRKLKFDTRDTVGFDKTKVECFNCHKIGHFARDCRAKGNQDSRRRDDGYNGNKAKDNCRRPVYQDDSKALVTIDREAIDWSGHVEEDTLNFVMMAYSSSNSGFNNEVKENQEKDKIGSKLDKKGSVVKTGKV
nr:putative ribonuclease H-like domain-containing protein [Tanacetum cinerariifolium]